MAGLNATNKPTIIIRSRFQPFTKYHAKLIRNAIDSTPHVALCIIRDLETINQEHSISMSVAATDLRHLRIFNPFTAWDARDHVESCLRLTDDLADLPIPIIISPLKFSDLVRLMVRNGKYDPQQLEVFMKDPMCDENMFEKCSVRGNLAKIISMITLDSMPTAFEYQWLFGIFDKGDKDDYDLALQEGATAAQVVIDDVPEVGIVDEMPHLGLYGQFMLCTYLKLLKELITDVDFMDKLDYPLTMPVELTQNDGSDLEDKVEELENCLSDYFVDSSEFERYESKTSDRIVEYKKKFNQLPPSEREVLSNFYEFKKLAQSTIQRYPTG